LKKTRKIIITFKIRFLIAEMSDLSVTILEVLSPELFIEIFRFLNGYDIYKAFYGLNHRLSALVLKYGINYIDLSEIRLYAIRKVILLTFEYFK
jgi:hypothetical protein